MHGKHIIVTWQHFYREFHCSYWGNVQKLEISPRKFPLQLKKKGNGKVDIKVKTTEKREREREENCFIFYLIAREKRAFGMS